MASKLQSIVQKRERKLHRVIGAMKCLRLFGVMKLRGPFGAMKCLWLAVFTLLFAVAPARAQIDAEQVTAIGRNVLAMDDYLLSIQYFNQAIKARPYMSDPYYYRGLAKLMLEDYQGAEEDCSLAIERNKFKYEAYRVRGFARMHLDRDSDAVADFDRGLYYAPNDRYFLFYKAITLADAQKYDKADSTFSELLRYYPRFDEGLAAYSRMQIARGDTTAALQIADRALAISKNQINPYLVKAEIYSGRNQWAEACEALDEAIRLMPQEASLYINRAFVRYSGDDWFGAMSDYNYAIDLDPDNRAAIYNRAMLRYQVQDLNNAMTDFTQILSWDPDNFPARYNRAMIWVDRGKYKEAIADLSRIIKRYPRFYQAYFAISELYGRMGDAQKSWAYFHKGNELTTKHVANPGTFRLDRPSIEPGKAITQSQQEENLFADVADGDDPEAQIESLNRLIVVEQDLKSSTASAPGAAKAPKGRVQDFELRAEPAPLYALTFADNPSALRSLSNYFRELNRLNTERWLDRTVFLSNDAGTQSNSSEAEQLFALQQRFDALEAGGKMRPVDYLGRAIASAMLKDYQRALTDLDKAVELDSDFVSPLVERAYVRLAATQAARQLAARSGSETPFSVSSTPEQTASASASGAASGPLSDMHRAASKQEAGVMLAEVASARAYEEALRDLDRALALDPSLAFAWFNKGCIYYALRDYTSALQCYNEAIRINPELGNAWYNRGITYMRLGNSAEAAANLSKAGELGIVPAYNILKRIQ